MNQLNGDKMKENREHYLQDTGAVVTPIEALAFWVKLWEAQNGQGVNVIDSNYSGNWFTPINSGFVIPTGFGAYSLNLLVVSDRVNQPLIKTNDDNRKGWEWGHTQLLTISLAEDVTTATNPFDFVISSNQRQARLHFNQDVVALARRIPFMDFIEKFSQKSNLKEI